MVTFQMGITGVPFGFTELLVPPTKPHEGDVSHLKGPRGLGAVVIGTNANKRFEFILFYSV